MNRIKDTDHDVEAFPWITCPASEARDQMEPVTTRHKQAWCSLCGTHLGATAGLWPA